VCNKAFSQAANLTAHNRIHTKEKPFPCPICQRRFSQSSSVTTHLRTHTKERPYNCHHCSKSFSDSSTLTKHMRIHSGEKPYRFVFRFFSIRFMSDVFAKFFTIRKSKSSYENSFLMSAKNKFECLRIF
ncbi:glass-like protein, partial [Euroglyphus maynei]